MNFGIGLSRSHRGAAFIVASLFVPPLLASCGSSTGTTPPTGTVIKDENNYTATSSLAIPRVQTTPGADLTICWDGITKDLLCHPVSAAADIDSVNFLQVLDLSEDSIQATLGAGQDFTRNVQTISNYTVDHTVSPPSTCATLAAFPKLGSDQTLVPAQDYVAGPNLTYMLLFANGTVAGSGSRSMMFLEPTAGSTNVTVAAPDGCGILDFTATISSLPVAIPAAGPWVVDWSQLKHDGLDNTVIYQRIDSLLLGYYGGMTVADLQARFLDLQIMANPLYQIALADGVKSADLATAKSASGEAFPGFNQTSGVWAVALMCSSCKVPAPIAVAILNPT